MLKRNSFFPAPTTKVAQSFRCMQALVGRMPKIGLRSCIGCIRGFLSGRDGDTQYFTNIETETGNIDIKAEDLDVSFARSSGPGGQNVNKRSTAVRLMHKPTGIQVHVDSGRSQSGNREKALKILEAKLMHVMETTKKKEVESIKGANPVKIEWGNQIRSYVFHPYKLVKDHRTNVETSSVDEVLDGVIDAFIDAEIRLKVGTKK